MQQSTIRVGLDVHEESVTAAVLVDQSTRAEVMRLPGELQKIRRLFRRLASRGHVRACYEASGTNARHNRPTSPPSRVNSAVSCGPS